jgi:thiamine biosynthesis lipoprotein
MTPRLSPCALLLTLSLTSCLGADEAATYRFSRFAMDTVVEYTIIAPSRAVARTAMVNAHEEIERVARLLWEEDSLSQVYALNHASGRIALDQETYDFLRRAYDYYVLSNGAFDITVKPVLDLYDFHAEAPTPPSAAAIAARLRFVGMDHLRFELPLSVEKTVADGVAVTVGGVAKGYAVDRAVQVLRAYGIEHAIVNAGGDLYCLGTNHGVPWTVGIQHPDDPTALFDTVHVSNKAIATSGDYQQYFTYEGKRYHHLLDPATGKPARRARSATVLAPTTEQADALATALFTAGKDVGLALLDSLPGVEGLLIDPSGKGYPSRHYTLVAKQAP